jgi:hypothetical protein
MNSSSLIQIIKGDFNQARHFQTLTTEAQSSGKVEWGTSQFLLKENISLGRRGRNLKKFPQSYS